jgi:hypothetical protein
MNGPRPLRKILANVIDAMDQRNQTRLFAGEINKNSYHIGARHIAKMRDDLSEKAMRGKNND